MTWPVRSKQLVFRNNSEAANTHIGLGTVPSGKVWLVKDWSIYNSTGSTSTFHLHVRSSGVVNPMWMASVLNGFLGEPGRQRDLVLMAGQELLLQTSAAGLVCTTVYGAQLG